MARQIKIPLFLAILQAKGIELAIALNKEQVLRYPYRAAKLGITAHGYLTLHIQRRLNILCGRSGSLRVVAFHRPLATAGDRGVRAGSLLSSNPSSRRLLGCRASTEKNGDQP